MVFSKVDNFFDPIYLIYLWIRLQKPNCKSRIRRSYDQPDFYIDIDSNRLSVSELNLQPIKKCSELDLTK